MSCKLLLSQLTAIILTSKKIFFTISFSAALMQSQICLISWRGFVVDTAANPCVRNTSEY